MQIDVALEAFTTVISSVGALLLAMNLNCSRWGWVIFMIANVLGFAWSIYTGHLWFVVQQCVFGCTSAVGIYRWILLPRRAQHSPTAP